MYERLELYIESLTGAAFELRVSPYETIQDIKGRIQKLEGIPIAQQHLIWQTVELEDECCLSDYSIQDGATLKLVLTMRGGPINTRRIPMDDPTLREMAEFLTEANRDELTERVSNHPVTVIVYHNGDQFNIYRVVDQDSTSPLPESLCGASVYNLYDEEEEDEEEEEEYSGEGAVGEDKHKENDKTREKMRQLRMKMENMTLSKQQQVKKMVPRPPSSGCPSGKARLRRLPSHTGGSKSASLNRNKCLPPVGKAQIEQAESTTSTESVNLQSAKELFHSATAAAGSDRPSFMAPLGIRRLDSLESTKLKPSLSRVVEDRVLGETDSGAQPVKGSQSADQHSTNCDKNTSSDSKGMSKETILRRAQSSLKASPKWEFSQEVLLKEGGRKSPASPSCAEMQVGASQEAVAVHQDTTSVKGLERLLDSSDIDSSSPSRPLPSSQIKSGLSGHKELHSRIPSTRHSIERLQSGGVILESLHPSEVRAMSGMLSSLVRSASKSRAGFTLNGGGGAAGASYKDCTRMQTPDGRLMSARLQRLSASREGHLISPTHRLPPVKQKKKSKRCFVCGKKTGLTNSYSCRCSHNYCATHRYPEAHNCTFDYKTEGRKLLEQNNPVISAPKLPKI